jgi:hypothetical protein
MHVFLTSGIISQSSRTVTLRSFSIVSSTFAIISSETDGHPERCSSWTSVRPSLNSLHHLWTCCTLIHTERNSQLAGEASGRSISNGCQAKTERHRQFAGAGTGRGGTKLYASAPGSHVTAFLTTAAPWEPYFTDNLRISLKTLSLKFNLNTDCYRTFCKTELPKKCLNLCRNCLWHVQRLALKNWNK